MDIAYAPEAWHDFYIMTGGAAAALTGLVFVAVSLHLHAVLGNPFHRGRAESTLLALMTVVLLSGAVLIPGQPTAALGGEVVLIGLASPSYSVWGMVHLVRRHRVGSTVELVVGPSIEVVVGLVGASLAILGGVSLIGGTGGGLWLLLPGAAIALGSSVWNAWRLMVDVAADPQP